MFGTPKFMLFMGLLLCNGAWAQQVSTVISDINASGGVSVGPDGNIYMSDFGLRLNLANGTTVYKVTPEGEATVFASGFSGASGSDFDADGNLIQANIGASRIDRVSPEGVRTTITSTGIVNPVGVAVASNGDIFVANCGNNTIARIAKDAVIATTFASELTFNCPNGLTIDPDDNLYMANFGNGNVFKITPAGEVSFLAQTPGSTFRPGGGNGHIVYGNERLYLATNATQTIYELTLDGQLSVLAGSGQRGHNDGAALEASFSMPNGIDVSADGRFVYVGESLSTEQTVLNGNTLELNPALLRRIDLGSSFLINAGVNDAWVSDQAPFQGLFFTVFEDIGVFFLSWFTFDSQTPMGGDAARFGADDQRWVTASGTIDGNVATLSVELTSGGIFNGSDPQAVQTPEYGEIIIEFDDCSAAMMSYDFPGQSLSGVMSLHRVLDDNIAMCEALQEL